MGYYLIIIIINNIVCTLIKSILFQMLKAIRDRCSLFVVDEAHVVIGWGTQVAKSTPFRKEFLKISDIITSLEVSSD